ncbi:hypothetical protein Dsin_022200 [Dipteronia sinensis]|uniref:Myb/SANT-like domain-containing protein n=1 Tax=Dipteronia sinensis TaxID=43782 RepID=A0AAE0A1I4_9ROSI|nr:hypothetical protein Dsin_022200 [Dipteronia sinensis]
MDRRTFAILCELLCNTGRLKTNGLVSVEEQVCIFLHILAHHVKNRTIHNRFYRSGETISRYFNSVLSAVLQLHNSLLVSPDPVPENCTDEWWKMFKRALDGTYIKVHVPEVSKSRFRTRKGEIATNVLGACSRDMLFTFAFPEWEGSASESRVLRDALSRPTRLKVPTGCYYLVDGGYTNGEGFLAPYRGTKYHLSEWRDGCAPINHEEYFNMKHASARNVIERCFGLLKKRWAILQSPSFYPIKTQSNGGRADCGSFKAGTLKNIELRLATILSNCSLRAIPHIESKLKTWKKQYGVIYDMINTSGFGWNGVRKCVEVDINEAWHSTINKQKDGEINLFPIYERLANIFRKDCATGKTAYTPESLAVNLEDDNFGNEFEMPAGNFSPMSVNQTDSNQQMNQASSQLVSRKRFRSRDPIVRSMDRFTNVMKDAIDKTTDSLDKMCQVLAKSKMNENRVIVEDLQKMRLPLSDQILVMQKFMQKPEIAKIFKAQQDEEQKLQLVASLLSGAFDV